tara:strand:- start:4818 stop:6389 length:1572 start_codon:yes stop_codon:yes gene_type:complete
MDFCILSAGVGSRFKPFSNYANKALAPFPFVPLISQLINSIPINNRIFIGTGYLKEDLEAIIKDIHSDRKIIFKQNIEFESTGMGDSLMNFIDDLSDSFIILPNDGIYKGNLINIDFTNEADIVLGSSSKTLNKDDYTNLKCDQENNIRSLNRKDFRSYEIKGNHISKIFTGFMYVKDKHLYKEYMKNYPIGSREIYFPIQNYIKEKRIIKEVEMDWTDCGTYDKYKNEIKKIVEYDFSKENETLLIYKDQKVFKIFNDKQISQKRVIKANLYPKAFPKCIALPSERGYSYDYKKAQTMYERSTKSDLIKLLKFLYENLWSNVSLDIDLKKDSKNFYKTKTLERISLLESRYDLNKINKINNKMNQYSSIIPPFDFDKIIENTYVSPIHGDLQYDNVLINNDNNFTLIDWRHEFGENVLYGDIYYDLAKLLGGIILNYKRIKSGQFDASLSNNNSNINFSYIEDEYSLSHQEIIYQFHHKNNLNIDNTRKLLSLIYINMSPLHEPPFDLLLLAYANKIFWSNA